MVTLELGSLEKIKINWNTQTIREDATDLFTVQSLSQDTKRSRKSISSTCLLWVFYKIIYLKLRGVRSESISKHTKS